MEFNRQSKKNVPIPGSSSAEPNRHSMNETSSSSNSVANIVKHFEDSTTRADSPISHRTRSRSRSRSFSNVSSRTPYSSVKSSIALSDNHETPKPGLVAKLVQSINRLGSKQASSSRANLLPKPSSSRLNTSASNKTPPGNTSVRITKITPPCRESKLRTPKKWVRPPEFDVPVFPPRRRCKSESTVDSSENVNIEQPHRHSEPILNENDNRAHNEGHENNRKTKFKTPNRLRFIENQGESVVWRASANDRSPLVSVDFQTFGVHARTRQTITDEMRRNRETSLNYLNEQQKKFLNTLSTNKTTTQDTQDTQNTQDTQDDPNGDYVDLRFPNAVPK